MNFNEYQTLAAKTAMYPVSDAVPGLYAALGLNDEAGEVAGKIKKYWRDALNYDGSREAIKKELGDVLWYLSETARQWNIELDDIAHANLSKLADRMSRDVIRGSGDDR